MKNIDAVFLKQLKETFKNKSILIHFLMFPVMVIIMENAVKLENITFMILTPESEEAKKAKSENGKRNSKNLKNQKRT